MQSQTADTLYDLHTSVGDLGVLELALGAETTYNFWWENFPNKKRTDFLNTYYASGM
jgi:hypothetical protein